VATDAVEKEAKVEMPGSIPGSLDAVPTLIRDPQPVEFEQLLERRRALGLDLRDEVWDGVYVMNAAPAEGHGDIAQQLAELLGPHARRAGLVPRLSIFNLGEADDYRIPDGGLLRERTNGVYAPTAALVVEIVSPDDESWSKLSFYAARHVDEILIVDLAQHRVDWLKLTSAGKYEPVERSGLIDLGPEALAAELDWPE